MPSNTEQVALSTIYVAMGLTNYLSESLCIGTTSHNFRDEILLHNQDITVALFDIFDQ